MRSAHLARYPGILAPFNHNLTKTKGKINQHKHVYILRNIQKATKFTPEKTKKDYKSLKTDIILILLFYEPL